ncbi:U-box domain-containing protein 19 [Linum perenne]
MIQIFNGSARRILTSPAVHPCESIAPETLLSSIISLCSSVLDFRSKPIGSNGRNARETVRQIGNLLIVLEEIRSSDSAIPNSFVLGLSELHLTVQKVRYLLDDCTRDGARLWMLMKSNRVANRFRSLARSVATGLEVLPLEDVEISCEVKEIAELVMSQARRTRIEVRAEDEGAYNAVLMILSRFEIGGVPDRGEMRRVMDYIGVKRWSDCYNEVKFLDSEIELQFSNQDMKLESELLSSLLGFMSYTRCVLFDSIDCKSNPPARFTDELFDCLNSDNFRCPISLELMRDPVTIETGHTYDRVSILKWFRGGNATCPNTGNKLLSKELVPNVALNQLIQHYCFENGIPIADSSRRSRDITRTASAGSLASEQATKSAASFLAGELVTGDYDARNKAAYEIRLLSKTSIFNRSCLVEAGVLPSLLQLLASEDGPSQENAIAALLNLSKHSRSKALIVNNGGLKLIVQVLKKGLTLEAKQHAAATLFYLASIQDYRKLIGETTDAISALVDMLKEANYRGKKNALVAIYALLMHPSNHGSFIASGSVPLLLDLLLSSDREELVTDSLAVLATLAEKFEGARSIFKHGALPQIVQILATATPRATKEHCVCLLLALSINGGEDVVSQLVKIPSLMGSLYSQLGEGTSRSSKKAGSLIRVLHQYSETSSSSSSSKAAAVLPPRDRSSVHVW